MLGLLDLAEGGALLGQVPLQGLLAVPERVDLLEPGRALFGRWSRERHLAEVSADLRELVERLFQLGLVACHAVLFLASLDDALPVQDVAIDLVDRNSAAGAMLR